jgi:hypothetical protein
MPELLVDGRTEDGLLFQGTRRWLNDEYFLVEGIGGSHGWEGKQREAWIGWTVAPAARVRAFLSYAGLNEDSEEPLPGVPVDPLAADDPEGWPSSLCDPYRPLLDTLVAEGRTYFLSEGDPAFRGDPVGRDPADPGAALPSIGLWSGQSLLSLISEEVETGARSVPANSLGCSDSARPVLSGTLGTLSLSSGRFCGLMVVGGDFRLGGDAKFQGLALVGGDMILQEDANFEGMLKVGNRFFQRDRASFRLSFCPVVRALDQIPALMRPILVKPG